MLRRLPPRLRSRLPGLVTVLLAAVLAAAASACASSGGEAASPPPVRTFVVGGNQHHDFDRWFDEETTEYLEAAGAEVDYTDDPDRVLPALAEHDVLYLSNNQALPDPALREAVFEHVSAGGGLMVGHAAAWDSWSDWPAYYRELVGGATSGHRAYGEFDVRVVAPDHPVMAGVPATFTVADELYWFERDPEGAPIEVLAEAEDPERGEAYPIVWVVERPTGRVVVNTLGHDGGAHEHPAYRRIQQNTVGWTAGSR